MRELLYAIKRFFIIGTGGYTRYSDYPDFDKKVQVELEKLRAQRAVDRSHPDTRVEKPCQ